MAMLISHSCLRALEHTRVDVLSTLEYWRRARLLTSFGLHREQVRPPKPHLPDPCGAHCEVPWGWWCEHLDSFHSAR